MTPTQRKAMEQALEALDDLRGYRQDIDDAIGALVEALAEPQGEPVAHFGSAYVNENGVHVTTVLGPVAIPQDAKLYTAPQPAIPPKYKLVPVDALTRWRDAFAEELSAWEIDPPLHHVLTSHDEISAMLAAAPEAPQSAKRVPLTDEWIRERCPQTWVFETVKRWVREVEAAHGITGETA